jgi:uncharacterized membrane protein required for colicin V production
VEQLKPFDLLILLALLAMFIVGYAQGVVRRLLGIGAILFSLFLAAQLRQPLGQYLAHEWATIPQSYSYMVAFGAVFLAAAAAISLGIQITYRPAPLFDKYPVLDEIVGGLLGVLEGFIILVALFLILDPHYNLPEIRDHVGPGEFTPLRSLHDLLDDTLTAQIIRNNVIPGLFAVLGFLFPQDVRDAFARAAGALLARR